MITFKISQKAEADDYIYLLYKEQKYSIEEFKKKFNNKNDEFFIDRLFKECDIVYKDKRFTYSEFLNLMGNISDKLPITQYYREFIKYEIDLFQLDRDYYFAVKLVESAEKVLQNARASLIEGSNILDLNINIGWDSGYLGLYIIRSMKINNAIMWYNNFFDSIMQVIFMAFGIYKKHKEYNDSLEYSKILKLCDFSFLSKFYGENKNLKNFKELWSILSDFQKTNIKINEWANYIKHKGGIEYKGIYIDMNNIFKCDIVDSNGKIIRSTDDFKPIILDLDDVIKELNKAHIKHIHSLEKLINFINFKGAYTKEDCYKKVIIK